MQDHELADHFRPFLRRDLLRIEAEPDPLRVEQEDRVLVERRDVDERAPEIRVEQAERLEVFRQESINCRSDGAQSAVRSGPPNACAVETAPGPDVFVERTAALLEVARL